MDQLSKAGVLVGIRGVRRGESIEMKPYALGGGERGFVPYSDEKTVVTKIGVDITYPILPTLTLDATINPDFAQVEADYQQINLTRFPLFFPEKRQFFLEGAGIFNFNLGYQPLLFYSREIGLSG